MKRSFHHTFRGRRYRIRWVPNMTVLGQCDHPGTPDKEILLRLGQSPAEQLDTIIHEALHACIPEVAEEVVEETASAITNLLKRLHYI